MSPSFIQIVQEMEEVERRKEGAWPSLDETMGLQRHGSRLEANRSADGASSLGVPASGYGSMQSRVSSRAASLVAKEANPGIVRRTTSHNGFAFSETEEKTHGHIHKVVKQRTGSVAGSKN